MKLDEIRDAYLAEGYSYLDAGSRVCQDVILSVIAKSVRRFSLLHIASPG